MNSVSKFLGLTAVSSALGIIGGLPAISLNKGIQYEQSAMPLSKGLRQFDFNGDERLDLHESGKWVEQNIDIDKDGKLSPQEDIELSHTRALLHSLGQATYGTVTFWKKNLRNTYDNLGQVQEIYRNERAVRDVLEAIKKQQKEG